MRSSKRAPSVISRSLRCIAATAVALPCMPGMPEAQRVVVGERATRHQRRDDVDVGAARPARAAPRRRGP